MTSPWVDGEQITAAKMYARTTALIPSGIGPQATGAVTITPAGSASPYLGTATVTFPTGRFATAPGVICTVQTGTPQVIIQATASNVNATGCTINLAATNTTARTVQWVAIGS